MIHDIDEYIKFLKSEFGLFITIHPVADERLVLNSELIKYNIHSSSFCTYLKTNPDVQCMCKSKQESVRRKLMEKSPFTGVCHAGIKERVYGLFLHEKLLGFISVSGYKTDKVMADDKLLKICAKYGLNEKSAAAAYEKLVDDFPNEKFLDSVIIPLCRMIEYGNLQIEQTALGKNELYSKILQYINENFCGEISVSLLSDVLNVSKSHISHTFKKMRGISISEYVENLRIELAKNLLLNTTESITQIAITVGFYDSSYFSNTFHRRHGISPKNYRRLNKPEL